MLQIRPVGLGRQRQLAHRHTKQITSLLRSKPRCAPLGRRDPPLLVRPDLVPLRVEAVVHPLDKVAAQDDR